jgi:mobilization protein NikA
MEQPEKNLPSPSAQTFAGLLASLAMPEKNGTERATGWNEEELADDVVTLSYEHALRAQATREAGLGESSDAGDPTETLRHGARVGERDPASSDSLRATSVTIRLSHAETARLRRRAAEAGLTVSAYVRSCMLETDALRAQVKEALAKMKTTAESTSAPTRKRWTGWMGRIRRRR